MRILHVMTSPRAEGTPRLALDWLATDGHVQGVAFLIGEPADLLNQFRSTGCWLRTGDSIRPGPQKFVRIARFVGKCAIEFQPDMIIAWPLGFSHWIFLGARIHGSRAALLSHGGNPPGSGFVSRYAMTWLCLWTTGLCRARMVACSRYVQRMFAELPLVPRGLVGFAYNSVQAKAIARRSDISRAARLERGFQAIMVATLETHKDHRTLIRAARLLKERSVDIEILIVGSGSQSAELHELAADLVAAGRVTFLGVRGDIPELLGRCDIFVLSTTPQEGRPGVILEALAAGLPIIASDVEPVREVLEDGKWGTLVQAGNAGALADALEAAAKAGKSEGAQVEARRLHAAKFTPMAMIQDYSREAGIATAQRS